MKKRFAVVINQVTHEYPIVTDEIIEGLNLLGQHQHSSEISQFFAFLKNGVIRGDSINE
jgi:pantothenate kinase